MTLRRRARRPAIGLTGETPPDGYGATVCSTVTGGRQANGLQPVATQQDTATSDGGRRTEYLLTGCGWRLLGELYRGPRALQVRQRAGGYRVQPSEAWPHCQRVDVRWAALPEAAHPFSKGPLDTHATSIIAIQGPAIEMEKGEAVGVISASRKLQYVRVEKTRLPSGLSSTLYVSARCDASLPATTARLPTGQTSASASASTTQFTIFDCAPRGNDQIPQVPHTHTVKWIRRERGGRLEIHRFRPPRRFNTEL